MKPLATAALLGLGLGLSSPSQADMLLGIYVGGGSVDYDLSGDFTDLEEDTNNTIDFEDELGLEGDSGTYFYVALEHGIPVLPNIRFARSEIDESGSQTLSRPISFDGVDFPAGIPVESKLDFSHNDFTFYYELLDNWVNLDLGLTARQFDGEISASSPLVTETAQEDLDFVVPMLYGKAQFDLPLTGLYVSAEGNWIGAGGAQLYDLWGKVGYTFAFGLGVEAGLRKMALELDDVEDLDADLTLDGTYIAATFHF
ncbi:MAG: hypothetical protein CML06_19055 [Pseudomonadales bacterium]|nr:hypothetical protein [Pseudomonadales bacterium]